MNIHSTVRQVGGFHGLPLLPLLMPQASSALQGANEIAAQVRKPMERLLIMNGGCDSSINRQPKFEHHNQNEGAGQNLLLLSGQNARKSDALIQLAPN